MIKSIMFGTNGDYSLFGIQVKFCDNYQAAVDPLDQIRKTFGPLSPIIICVAKTLQDRKFAILTQWYSHVFMHEMGHAFACKLFGGEPLIRIFPDGTGYTQCTRVNGKIISSPDRYTLEAYLWKDTVISVAGPIGSVAFSTIKLITAALLRKHIPWPISLALISGPLISIPGELIYAVSCVNAGDGDFGNIARNGKVHLAAATTAFISSVALGIFLTSISLKK